MARWEARRALRWGSEHVGWFGSLGAAEAHAQKDIAKHGNEGRVEQIDRVNRILYYDVHAELT